MAIAGAIKGFSIEKFYQELGSESLQNLCVTYKIVKEQSSKYLSDLIPSNSNIYQTKNSQTLGISHSKKKQ